MMTTTMDKKSCISMRERFRGALMGVAVGDAFGTGVNHNRPNTVAEIIGGGPFGLRAGEWTDDTALTLCCAESLIEMEGFDPISHLDYMLAWYEEGLHSCRPYAFDIGGTIRRALMGYRSTGSPSPFATGSGNGSLMRVAPIALYYADDPALASDTAGRMSRTTHGVIEATDACRYWAGLIAAALGGLDKATLLQTRFHGDPQYMAAVPLCPAIAAIAGGTLTTVTDLPDIATNGYVVSSLHVALWGFATTDTFEDGLRAVVNIGGDTDSIGAIYGALAGAFYGVEAIPVRWRRIIRFRSRIEGFADHLLPHA